MQSIQALKEKVGNTEALKNNDAVKRELEGLEEGTGSLTGDLGDKASDAIDEISNSIDVWSDPDADPLTLTSTALKVASKIAEMASVVPEVGPALGVLGSIFGLFGSILGAFSSQKGVDILQKIKEMIDDALDNAEFDEVKEGLNAELAVISDNIDTMTKTMSVLQFQSPNAGDPIILSMQPSDLTREGLNTLTVARDFVNDKVDIKNRKHWGQAAQVYHAIAQVLTLKVISMHMGIGYFRFLDANTTGKTTRSRMLQEKMGTFFQNNIPFMRDFVINPSIARSGITHEIYRLDSKSFSAIRNLFDFFVKSNNEKPEEVFWPWSSKRYREIGSGNVRITTLQRRQKGQVLTSNGDSHDLVVRFSEAPGDDSEVFSMWTVPDAPEPTLVHRWYTKPKNSTVQTGFAIFNVEPSDSETGEFFKSEDRKYLSDDLIIISQRRNGEVDETAWRSSRDRDEQNPINTAYYKAITKDHPMKDFVWLLLKDSEL